MAVPTVLAMTARRNWIPCSWSDSGAVAAIVLAMMRSPACFSGFAAGHAVPRPDDQENCRHISPVPAREWAPTCVGRPVCAGAEPIASGLSCDIKQGRLLSPETLTEVAVRSQFHSLYRHDFVRLASCVPRIEVGDPDFNFMETMRLAERGDAVKSALMVFPELGLSSYAIEDLLFQDALLRAVERRIGQVAEASQKLYPV